MKILDFGLISSAWTYRIQQECAITRDAALGKLEGREEAILLYGGEAGLAAVIEVGDVVDRDEMAV